MKFKIACTGARLDGRQFEVEARSADGIAKAIHGHIRKNRLLASKWFEVVVEMDEDDRSGRGAIESGRFGTFTVEAVS